MKSGMAAEEFESENVEDDQASDKEVEESLRDTILDHTITQ